MCAKVGGEDPPLMVDLLVVDDDPVYSRYLASQLRRAGYGVQVAHDLGQAAAAIAQRRPDLVLLDLNLGGEQGLDLRERLSPADRRLPVVVVTGDPTVGTAVRALRQDVVDYVTKAELEPARVVGRALRQVSARRSLERMQETMDACRDLVRRAEAEIDRLQVLTDEGGGDAPGALPLGDLSAREWEVVQQVRLGRTNKEIAAALFLSTHTVANHLRSIFRKLDVSSRTELVSRL